jgi:hypothetical protein
MMNNQVIDENVAFCLFYPLLAGIRRKAESNRGVRLRFPRRKKGEGHLYRGLGKPGKGFV